MGLCKCQLRVRPRLGSLAETSGEKPEPEDVFILYTVGPHPAKTFLFQLRSFSWQNKLKSKKVEATKNRAGGRPCSCHPSPSLVPARAHLGEAGAAGEAAALSGAHPPPGPVQAALRGAACAADQYGLRAAELLFTPKGLVWMKGGRGARVHRITVRGAAWHFPPSLRCFVIYVARETRGFRPRKCFPHGARTGPGREPPCLSLPLAPPERGDDGPRLPLCAPPSWSCPTGLWEAGPGTFALLPPLSACSVSFRNRRGQGP